MSDDFYTVKMRKEYETIFSHCNSLNTALSDLTPLAKQMHLLSSNAVSSAARAGSEGDAFRVLTQDIQLLGDDVADYINDTQPLIANIVERASVLTTLFSEYSSFDGGEAPDEVVEKIQSNNIELSRSLTRLSMILAPVSMLAKKGQYLAVFSSVEAASSGEHGGSFEAVSSMLKELVNQLAQHAQSQRSLLRDLSESIEYQEKTLKKLLYAR